MVVGLQNIVSILICSISLFQSVDANKCLNSVKSVASF